MNSYIYLTFPRGGQLSCQLIMLAGEVGGIFSSSFSSENFLVIHRPYLLPQEVGCSRKKMRKELRHSVSFCVLGAANLDTEYQAISIFYTNYYHLSTATGYRKNRKLRARFVMHSGRFFALMIAPRCSRSETMLHRADLYRNRLGRH